MGHVVEGEYEIVNALGLHARAAAQLVKCANRFKCDVAVECDGQTVNGKSIMGLLMLAGAQGMKLKLRCSGDDAPECLEALRLLISDRFGEGQ